MNTALTALNSVRINGIMQGLQDARDLPAQLKFLGRTPIVPATDNEILARIVDRVLIADVVANDQEALVYSAGKLTFESYVIPNLKVGSNVSQEMLNQLNSFSSTAVVRRGPNGEATNLFDDYRNRKIANLLLGVRQRMEALIIGMQTDFAAYDRLGIKFQGTYGMPSDLKVTVATGWDSTSGTPVTDIWTQINIGSIRYGIKYNRATMSTQAFRYMIATTDFQNKARAFIPAQYSTTPFTYINQLAYNSPQMMSLATSVLGVDFIELYDARYWVQGLDGVNFSQPFLPIVKVVLSSTESDGDPNVMDFANAVTTESLVASVLGSGMIGGAIGEQYGPIAYATAPNSELNPPAINMWGVARGIPRKFYQQATSVLTVGSFTDTIPVTEPAVV